MIRQWHWNRNKHQQSETYLTLSEALEHGYTRFSPGNKDPESQDNFHEQGLGNEGNDKYTKRKGKLASCELIFNSEGKLVTDPINIGTYNFIDGDVFMLGHYIVDVLPYLLWGNNKDDKSTFKQRVKAITL